jgi:signal transduction histidine kinase
MSRRLKRSDLKRYIVSVLLVFAATIFTIAIKSLFAGRGALIFFTIAVILSAAYGGIGTGLLATALSLGIILLLFRDHVFFALITAQSSLTLFVAVGVAITMVLGKLRDLNEALIAARENLEAANRELTLANDQLLQRNHEVQHFAYGLAHDLHNPLRSIGALADLLINRNAEKLDERSQECARMIVSGVQRMESMIKSLLDYAAVTEGTGHQDSTDCNTILDQVLQDLRHTIEISGALVTSDTLPTVKVNEGHLAQVFSNLIGNAIKYRSDLEPRIHISVKGQRADWLFAVSDNGIGLDMKYADNIFGMFKRLHGSKGYEGSGVGLALCKVAIQRNGGRIWVDSEPGKGSTFFFTLPKTEESNIRRTSVATEPTPFRAKKAAT